LTRKLIIIPLILLLASCTITKRVHRPGYHVQWRKIERSNVPNKSHAEITEVQSIERDEIVLITRKVETIHDLEVNFDRTPVSQFSEGEPTMDLHETQAPTGHLEEIVNVSSGFTSNEQKAAPPIFWRTPPENLKKLGIAFIILGSLFLFASLLIYLGAFSGNGGYAWLNFFLDLVSISEWLWIFVFILLFVLVVYLFFLLVLHVLGGPLTGVIVGLSLLLLGIFFYELGKRRTPEPPAP